VAVLALLDAKCVINSVNLSDHITKITLKTQAADLDTTAMGATYQARIGGLKSWSADIEFNQDFAASNVDATIFPLLGTVVAITAKATSGANATTNPEYQGNVLVQDYTPLDGQVGALAKTSVSWPGTGTLTRATS
jgi:hypothetical protein